MEQIKAMLMNMRVDEKILQTSIELLHQALAKQKKRQEETGVSTTYGTKPMGREWNIQD